MGAKLPVILKSLGWFKQLGAILIVCSTFILRSTFVCEGRLWQTVAQTNYNKASRRPDDAEDNRNQIICSWWINLFYGNKWEPWLMTLHYPFSLKWYESQSAMFLSNTDLLNSLLCEGIETIKRGVHFCDYQWRCCGVCLLTPTSVFNHLCIFWSNCTTKWEDS